MKFKYFFGFFSAECLIRTKLWNIFDDINSKTRTTHTGLRRGGVVTFDFKHDANTGLLGEIRTQSSTRPPTTQSTLLSP